MSKTLGQIARDAYWNGARSEPWKEIGPEAQADWERAAAAVADACQDGRRDR